MQLICVLCMNGWQSCPKNKAVSDVPVLTRNAAATMYGTIHIYHTNPMRRIPLHHSTQRNFFSCVVLIFVLMHTAENGVLIAKTNMSYCGMVRLG